MYNDFFIIVVPLSENRYFEDDIFFGDGKVELSDWWKNYSIQQESREHIFEDKKNIFRKVEKTTDDELIYVGNLNVSILEAMLGVALNRKSKVGKEDVKKIRYRYKNTMYGILEKSFNRIEENPFSVSTGTMQSIQRRFEICEMILGCR